MVFDLILVVSEVSLWLWAHVVLGKHKMLRRDELQKHQLEVPLRRRHYDALLELPDGIPAGLRFIPEACGQAFLDGFGDVACENFLAGRRWTAVR